MNQTPYRNNLVKRDRVMHAENKRVGEVRYAGESSVWAGVVWQGTTTPQQTHVSKLRLVVNGKPEDVPPVDGDIPTKLSASRIDAPAKPFLFLSEESIDGLSALKAERKAVGDELAALNDRYRETKARGERLDKAIAVLEERDGQ